MNDARARIMEDLAVLQKNEHHDRNFFKARAYGKVVGQLKGLGRPIYSAADLDGIEGIGGKIRVKILEILETGHLAAASRIKDDPSTRMKEILTNIYGVGPVKAKRILESHPVTSLEEFREAVATNPSILHEKQHVGLRYYEDFLQRIPRAEMRKHEKLLKSAAKALHSDIVGSFRRGAADSGDIDMLIGYPSGMGDAEACSAFGKIIERLQAKGYILDVLASGPKKFMGVCRLPGTSVARRLDLLLTPADEYPYALLYFTGSDKFNIRVRKLAMQKGYTLNEHAMKPVKEGVPPVPASLATEKEILDFLGVEWLEPSNRS